MKWRLLYLVVWLSAFMLPVEANAFGYTKDAPLKIGIDKDYPPLEYLDESGNPSGFDVEFTEKLMKRLDIPFVYAPNTWQNIAGDILSGKVDLGMMVYSPYRRDITNYSRAVFRLYYQMIIKKGERKNGLRDVKGKTIALMKSRPLIDTLTKIGAKIVLVKDLKKAVFDFSKGKYDGVICFRYQAQYLLEHYHLNELTSQDLTLTPREYCYVSHNRKLIDAIDEELEKMEDEGVTEKVYGDVRSTFGKLIIPVWVWFLIAGLVILMLTALLIQQHFGKKNLRKEMIRAQKSEQLKDIFLNNVSHALRTPLNAIIGFSDLMLETEEHDMSAEEQRKLLRLINDNGLQLLHLINQLLSLSDIKGNNALYDRKVTDIDQEMSSYAGEIRPQLSEGVTLEVLEPVDGIRALVDAKLLRVVTMHLLENAMQYTKEGKVTLSYYVKEGGLYVEVKDTGSGIPENLRDNIFGLLSEKNTYLQEKAPGLGLSICKAIIDRSGGKIGMKENEEGKGTVFWYWISVKILN